MKVIIIGAVAGGANTATRLRRLDENAEIIIFERGNLISYAACGLPYFIGGKIAESDALALHSPQSLHKRYNLDVRINSEVTSIDRFHKTVTVNDMGKGKEYAESYDKLVIATGANPIRPPIPGIDSERVFTLRTIPDAQKIKAFAGGTSAKSAMIIGGGGIGLELAENLKALNLDVTIVELADHLLAQLDFDMASFVHDYARARGIKLITGNGVKSLEEGEGGLTARLDEGEAKAGMAIMCTGVRPDSFLAKEAGLVLGERGAIAVNKQMRTSDPDIYAVGDVAQTYNFITGKAVNIALAGPAARQARVAANDIAGVRGEYGGTLGTGIVKFFGMTIAFTGLSEREAAQNGIDYDKIFITQKQHAEYYPGACEINLKVVFDRTNGKILGAQVIGEDGADKRCDVLAMAIRMGATAADLEAVDLAYSPPYSSPKDPVNTAGQVIDNVLKKEVDLFNWNDVGTIPKDGGVTLLDVRKTQNDGHGTIDGFKNVPLDSLRDEANLLDREKPVYIHCKDGKQSYVAARILRQRGFSVRSLSGGITVYSSTRRNRYRTRGKSK